MTSGYMWCQIRKPLYAQAGQGGQVSYIQGGYQSQLGAEVHIVSAICESSLNERMRCNGFQIDQRDGALDGILGLSVYTLAYTVPKLRDPVRQRLAIYVWTGVLIAMASVLYRVFQTKQPGCKFRFLAGLRPHLQLTRFSPPSDPFKIF